MTMGNEAIARAAAQAFRESHRLGADGIADLFTLVHSTLRIDVLSTDASESEHGLTMKDPSTGRIVIAVATTPHPMRQRSSVAHEVGHVVLGHLDLSSPLVPGARSAEEIRADAFARHLLLPLTAVRERRRADGPARPEDLSDLVQEFGVSPSIAAIQMREVRWIDEQECTRFSGFSARRLAAQHGWLNEFDVLQTASASPRAPQQLTARAVRGVGAGVLGLDELAQWYGLPVSEIEDVIGPPAEEATGMTPDERSTLWALDDPLFPGRDEGGRA